MERSAIPALSNLRISLPSLAQCMFPRQGDDAAKLRVELLQSMQIYLCQSHRLQFTVLNPSRKLPDRSKGDIFFNCRQGLSCIPAANKAIAARLGEPTPGQTW